MDDQPPPPRPRRRRGRRSGQQRPAAQPPQAEASAPQPRPPRQDTRRARSPAGASPPGPSGPPRGRIQRAPAPEPRREREGRPARDGLPRAPEAFVPQDERSLQLGAMFREAQAVLRDARKALEKRRLEFGDEPEWMVEQLREAERRFEQVATQWVEHLSKTGRKVVRR